MRGFSVNLPRSGGFRLILCIAAGFCIVTVYQSENVFHTMFQSIWKKPTFEDLIEYHSHRKTILMSLVDSGYKEMALNLWETSLKKFNITNYIFVCITKDSFDFLAGKGLNSYFYEQRNYVGNASRYGTKAYKKKTVLKTIFSKRVISLGYNVLVVDVDIVFLRNPLPHFVCAECDIIGQTVKGYEINTGFYMLRPTQAAITLQERVIDGSNGIYKEYHDQKITYNIMSYMRHLNVVRLPGNKFCDGCTFFPKRQFFWDYPKTACVIVHNTCQSGYENKVYKFKEMLMWVVDTNGYYSHPSNKYIIYTRAEGALQAVDDYEFLHLVFSIGKLLNRIVILPVFDCKGEKCNLLKRIGELDSFKMSFGDQYREHSFLSHPKVPQQIKTSLSPQIAVAFTAKETSPSIESAIVLNSSISKQKLPEVIVSKLPLKTNAYSVLRIKFMALH